jgi:UDP-N-acetyl-D-glucosamine/UDP-N-acetyl-D-galactosamine dehydrogenase
MKKIEGTVAVVGLGYVGLPLAVSLAATFPWSALTSTRAASRNFSRESTAPAKPSEATSSPPNIQFHHGREATAPVQVHRRRRPDARGPANVPDLEPVISASRIVGENLNKGSIVIFESTVYPGVTEEVCLPILEEKSGLKLGDFKIGYSPERINPGDHEHTVDKVVKIVSGCDAETLEEVSALYSLVAKSVFRASSIATAEAAKVIENIQRDLNIALMNELSLIFSRLGLNTDEVLAAAGTKWNFHKYHPGLVGGHCIGVDPYYLTYRAQQFGYHPQVILAGRQINDSMPIHVGEMVIKGISHVGKPIKGATVLILGLTFKENVPDIRNSKVHDTITYLQGFGSKCSVAIRCFRRYRPQVFRHRKRRVRQGAEVRLRSPREQAQRLSLAHARPAQGHSAMSPPVLIDIKNLFDRKAAEPPGFITASL